MTPDPRIEFKSAIFKLHCVISISFPKLAYPQLSGLLYIKSTEVWKTTLSLASLKLSIQCTVSLIFDLFARKHANLMVAQHSVNIVRVYIFDVLPTNIYMLHNYMMI